MKFIRIPAINVTIGLFSKQLFCSFTAIENLKTLSFWKSEQCSHCDLTDFS